MTVYADRVKETTTTEGAALYIPAGAAAGFRAFSTAFTVGDVVEYCAEDGTDWEVGSGELIMYGPALAISRDTILASSNEGAAINWGPGTRNLFGVVSASAITAMASGGVNPADFATAAQGVKADAALPKAGGTMTGALTSTMGAITTDTPAYNATQTWNDGGVTFTALKVNATSTASASGSKLLDCQESGVSKFYVRKDGVCIASYVLAVQNTPGSWDWAALGSDQYHRNVGRVAWTDGDALAGTADITITRAAANILGIANFSSGGGAVQLTEMTAPSAGAANTARIFCEDNGAGKTRLMVQFATGAAQQIAIEP